MVVRVYCFPVHISRAQPEHIKCVSCGKPSEKLPSRWLVDMSACCGHCGHPMYYVQADQYAKHDIGLTPLKYGEAFNTASMMPSLALPTLVVAIGDARLCIDDDTGDDVGSDVLEKLPSRWRVYRRRRKAVQYINQSIGVDNGGDGSECNETSDGSYVHVDSDLEWLLP
jgi:hypothetical protein